MAGTWLMGAATLAIAAGTAHAQDKGTVYYLIPTLLDEFQTESKKAFEHMFGSLGYEVVSVDADNRSDRQLSQLEDAIATSPAAIVLAAVDFDAIVPGVEAARAAGIPVLNFDRQIRTTEFSLTSVAGTVEMGYLAAGEVVRLLEERNGSASGKVLQVLGDPGDNYTLDIQAGFEEVMAGYPDVEIVTKATLMWEPANAADIIEDQLLVNPDIDVIFGHAAHLCSAMIAVMEGAGKAPGDIAMLCSNGAPEGLKNIRNGWQQAEVEQPLYAQMYGLAMFADMIIGGQTPAEGTYDVLGLESTITHEAWGPNLKIPGAVITADNVDGPAFWGNLNMPTDPVTPVQ
ncbi:MAG: sugar ABC transporter substrate-binding protein [Alphaproteobacteria bacterium]